MTDKKLSQIGTGGTIVASTDTLVGVRNGTTDVLLTPLSNVISKQFTLQIGADGTYALDSYADFAYTINALNGVKTTSGTISAAIKINGTNVTGLSAVAITSTPQQVSASAANTVSVGDRVTVVLSSNSSAVGVEFSMQATRTS